MNQQHLHRLTLLVAATLLTAWSSTQAQAQAQRIGGDIVAVDNAQMQMKSRAGEVVTVKLAPTLSVSARSQASLAMIAPGAFLGTTAIPQPDGTLKATEVHIFPESMRGTGEGHRPYDFTPGGTMTNATVSSVSRAGSTASGSTMTNATVAGVDESAGTRTMKLTYKGGEKTVVVPSGTPIVMVEAGDRSLLVPGAHIVITATRGPDGALTTDRIMVGTGGLVPPL
jgi:hypothetical protein